MQKIIFLFCCILGLSACSSDAVSPLSLPKKPVINIEAVLAPVLVVDATDQQVILKNTSQHNIKGAYLLTWYNQQGVTQRMDWRQDEQWHQFILAPQQRASLPLQKPTEDSVNYRVYVKAL